MALPTGIKAQDIALSTTDGKPVVLSEILQRGPVVLAFFKISCPVCQYTFPYLERLWQIHKSGAASFIGVSQDNQADTLAFMQRYGVTFPVVIDSAPRYAASKEYQLTNVPSIFLVNRDGDIEVSSVGWLRKDMEDLNARLSMINPGQQQYPLFKPGEEIAQYKAG